MIVAPHQAGFSPRVRYEATTVYGVLDLVSADLGVALVPASTALLGIKGVTLRPLRKQGAGR
jgi:DNA-binding transcriptional LysR family regulator